MTAGEAGSRLLLQIVLHFVPKRGAAQRFFDDHIQLLAVAKSIQPEPGGNIVVNRHTRKWVGLLKHHANTTPYIHRRNSVAINVHVAHAHSTLSTGVRMRFVHAIQAADECGLAAAGRTNNRRGMVGQNVHSDLVKGLVFSKPGIQAFDFDINTHQRDPSTNPRLATQRTDALVKTIRTISTSAPPHASRCHSSNGEIAYTKI